MEETKSAPDHRYEAMKLLIEKMVLKRFSDIFHFIPKQVVARDLGQSYPLFSSKISQPWRFTLEELTELAGLVGVSIDIVCELLERDIKDKRKTRPLKPRIKYKHNIITG